MMVGKRYNRSEEAEDNEEPNKFRDMAKDALKLTSASNPGEFFNLRYGDVLVAMN